MTNSNKMSAQQRKIDQLTNENDQLKKLGKQQADQYNKQMKQLSDQINLKKTRMNTRYNIIVEQSKKWFFLFIPVDIFKKRIQKYEEFVIAASEQDE